MKLYSVDVYIINKADDGTRGNTYTKKLYEKYYLEGYTFLGNIYPYDDDENFIYDAIKKIGFYYSYNSENIHKDEFIRTYYIDMDFGKINDTTIEYVRGLLLNKIRQDKLEILL